MTTRRRLRLLLLEDHPDDAELTLRQLRRDGFEPEDTRVETEADFVRALESGDFDVILSDYRLPSFDGMSALQLAQSLRPQIPFIIVSGTIGEEIAVAAMRAGASDYLLKDRLTRLGAAVQRALNEARLRAERDLFIEAIQDAEAQFRSVFDHALEGLFLTSVDGRLHAANGALAEIFGYATPDDMVAEMVEFPAERLSPDDPSTALFAARLASDGAVRQMPLTALRRDGTPISVVLSIHDIVDARGARHRTGLLVDVTSHRRTEAALVQSQSQLRQAQKMEAIGLLAGGIAHDFNNLLQVILGTSDLALSESPADPGTVEALEVIESAAQRAAAMTRQLLTFSKRQVSQTSPLQLNDMLIDIESLLRRLIGEDIELHVTAKPHLPTMMGDRSQLEQVLLNLAINSRDAMPAGGKLAITAESRKAQDGQGETVVLIVSDTGVGMDAPTREQIFEPFFTTKPPGRGTGLGLAIVRDVVVRFNGWIDVTSEPGRGTVFEIGFPALPGGATAQASPSASRMKGRSLKVLVVEDDEAVRALLLRMLEASGHHATSTGRPTAALAAVRGDAAFDLLITDVIMPEMTGPELVAQIIREAPAIRVLYCSGYSAERLEPVGADRRVHLLSKPFSRSELDAAVATVFAS